ncbi:uncharacterized protein LOC128736636 [Sabethes cyaneus]|uniref:uncharacterized protein LOC128736636 n=1 Tax=Sabethes cyaneus TaxID=53552 RepID=UPI00237D6B2D|nr:uncharacterized protein LOC128736636 [Sabethes cyaneus]
MSWKILVFYIFAVTSVASDNLLMSNVIINGYVFPTNVTVAVDESVHLKILLSMNDDDRCLYREPGSTEDVDVHATFRHTYQNSRQLNVDPNECGIKISKITRADAGFWRLTLVRGTTLVRGVSMISVIDAPVVPDPGFRDSIDGLEEITPEGTDYCYMLRNTETQTRDVPSYETCSLDANEMDPTGSGRWNVIVGVQGYMREMHFGVDIQHKEEQIVTSIHRAAEYEVLTCNLRYVSSKQMIKFCRFLRLADSLGLNMLEGVGWDRYRYSGNGFAAGDCGLEIEEPAAIDRGLWKCIVGFGDEATIKVSGAIVDNREIEVGLAIIAVEDVNVLNGTDMILQCNANKPLDYCWFKDPTGMIYSVSESSMTNEDGYYWYSGISLAMGDCGIKLKPITTEMAGRWSCHVGSSNFSALEVSEYINVRVSLSQMIGTEDYVHATLETAMLIECSSIPKHTPLQYCRFVPPSGEAFSLEESVASDNAILGKYYSNPSHDPKNGFCSLIVKTVSNSDVGQWICAGKIAGHTMEHYTTIEAVVSQNDAAELTVASIVGMALGSLAILVIVVGIGFYNYRRRLRRQVETVNREIEMQERRREEAVQEIASAGGSSRSSRSSQHSQRSDNQLRTG